jgi:hypothetical protein
MASSSPPKHGRTPPLRGYLPLNAGENSTPLTVHGSGALAQLITRTSTASGSLKGRSPSFSRVRDALDDEEASMGRKPGDEDADFGRRDERRLSAVLNGPQMRSMRLIGNSNPRYRWERYWKTEDELKKMKKPMYEEPAIRLHNY